MLLVNSYVSLCITEHKWNLFQTETLPPGQILLPPALPMGNTPASHACWRITGQACLQQLLRSGKWPACTITIDVQQCLVRCTISRGQRLKWGWEKPIVAPVVIRNYNRNSLGKHAERYGRKVSGLRETMVAGLRHAGSFTMPVSHASSTIPCRRWKKKFHPRGYSPGCPSRTDLPESSRPVRWIHRNKADN